MADIHILREHRLGLAKARELALAWADDAQQRLQMACTVVESDDGDGDTVHFKRRGASGTLQVAADRFELHAKLGLLLGAFSSTIEAEIIRNLDALLSGKEPTKKPPPA